MTTQPDWGHAAVAGPTVSKSSDQRAGSRFHEIVAITWLLLWLGNLTPSLSVLLSVNLYYPVVAVFLLYLAVSRPFDLARVMLRPLMFVWLLTMVLPVVMYVSSPTHGFAYISMRTRIVYFSVLAGSAVLLQGRDARETMRTAGFLSLLIGIPFNLLELVVPNILSTAPGRSAGFHVNPNTSAAALIVALLLAVDFSRHRRRDLVLVFFAYLAVLTTFSRSGILFATFVTAVYLFVPQGEGTLTGGQRMSLLVVGGVALLITAVAVLQFIQLDPGAYGRIQSILTGSYVDNSSQGRLESARFALDQFLGNFWTGRGLGSPEYYALSTHNTFLAISVEFGIAGLLIYLLLLFQGLVKVVRHGWQVALNMSLLALYLLYYSAFDHQIHLYGTYAVGFSALVTNALLKRTPEPPPRSS